MFEAEIIAFTKEDLWAGGDCQPEKLLEIQRVSISELMQNVGEKVREYERNLRGGNSITISINFKD